MSLPFEEDAICMSYQKCLDMLSKVEAFVENVAECYPDSESDYESEL